MRSTVIVLAAAFVSIALAWFLFAPTPGSSVPAAPAPTASATPPPALRPGAPVAAPGEPPTASQQNAAFQARINEPDAALSGMQSSAWTVIRRELSQNPAASALMAEASDLVRDLRDARLRPDNADRDGLAQRQADLRKRIGDSGFATPLVEEQFKRLDELSAANAARPGAAPTAPPPAPAAAPATTPPAGEELP